MTAAASMAGFAFEAAVAHALGHRWRPGGIDEADLTSIDGQCIVELKRSSRVPARDLIAAVTRLAFECRERGAQRAVLAWWTQTLSLAEMGRAWEQLRSVLAADVAARLQLVMASPDAELILPHDALGTELIKAMRVAAADLKPASSQARPGRTYDVLKILLVRWLRDEPPIALGALQDQSGLSHPTVAQRLDELGNSIGRTSNRRVYLREFPVGPWAELIALSPRVRQTTCFEDRSGRTSDLAATVARLRRQAPPNVAIGGVIGARHWQPDLDLDGIPRIDLAVHAPAGTADLDFVARLDPALVPVRDDAAAILAVHTVTRAASLFADAPGHGLRWADPVEILLDLHELRLTQQADDFVRFWRRR